MPQFKIVEHVTLPQLKLGSEPVYLKFLAAIFEAEDIAPTPRRNAKNTDGEEASTSARKMAPPELAQVLNLVDGKPYHIIVNTVLGAELRKKYPGDKYVGLSFQIQRNQIQGKRYATFDIARVEVQDDQPANTAPVKGGKH